MSKETIIVGITGSTGAIYGIRLLEELRLAGRRTHLIITEWGEKCIRMETPYSLQDVRRIADGSSEDANMASGVSSGTHRTAGMAVAPCSMKTLSAIANGYDDTLVARAAGVTIKESRQAGAFGAGIAACLGHPSGKHAKAGAGWASSYSRPMTEFYTQAPRPSQHMIDHARGQVPGSIRDRPRPVSQRWGETS